MSLHVGAVRVGHGPTPLLDVLYDTTDSALNRRAFCHVVYHPVARQLTAALTDLGAARLGVEVLAYQA